MPARPALRRHTDHLSPSDVTSRLDRVTQAALAVSSVEGPDAVQELVLRLARTLGVDAAMVSVQLPGEPVRMRAVAACLNGRRLRPFEYELAHTPCRAVVGRETRYTPHGVHAEFQPGTLFHAKGFDSYAARVLRDARGQAFGLIVVLGRSGLPDEPTTELLLRIFGVRAAAEIERMRNEAELKASEASYREIFAASDDGIFVHDADTFAIVDVNPKVCEMYGYSRREMLVLNVGAISANVPPWTQVEAAQWMQRARDGETVRLEWRARHRSGTLRWDEVKLKAAVIGGQRRILAMVRDITESKRADQALRVREAQYRAIFEVSADAMVLWNERLEIVDVNPAFLSMYGFKRTPGQVGHYPDTFPPEYVEQRRALVRRALQGESSHLETVALRADGSRFDVDLRVIPFQHRGTPHVLAIVRDITERLRAEQQLRASEARYRMLFEMESDAIVLIDVDTLRLVDVNPAACALYGYRREELLGLRATDLSVEAEATRLTIRGEDPCGGMPQRLHRRRDGSVFPVEISTSRFELDGRPTFLAAVRDITERRERERALQLSEARLRATVEAAFDSVIGMDAQGCIVEFNAAAERCFGYRREDVIGQRLAGLIIPHRHRQAHDDGMSRFHQTGRGPYIGRLVETSALRADGTEFPIELAISVAHGPEGDTFVGYLRDISERKRAQAHRDRLEAQLRQAQKMQAIGQLTGGIAHDFNNILASIMGYVVLAEERALDAGDAALADPLAQALQSCRRARDLIQQMLTFSRGQRGEMHVQPLAPVVQESVRILRSTLPATVSLDVQADDTALAARVDAVQVQQVLLNLAINARDAMQGHGRIAIALQAWQGPTAVCASCRASVQGPLVALSVRDSGPGVPALVQERMFEPFYSTKETGQGSGMGLAMVHGIVHDHGGHVLVESAPDQGACFHILLPQADAATAPAPPQPGARRRRKAALHGRVLLVDDEDTVREAMGELLRYWGLDVVATGDPHAAHALLLDPAEPLDLLLSDQTMPGLTGLDLARAVRDAGRALPVLLYSGRAEAIDPTQQRAAGVHQVLAKPVEPAALRAALGEVLGRGPGASSPRS